MNDWDKRYEAGEHVNDAPHPLITGFVSKLTPGRALDVASGTGRHSLWLAERGWQNPLGAHPRATGLDPAALDAAAAANAPPLPLLSQTHEIARLTASLTSVLTTLSSPKPPVRRPLENPRRRQRPGLARLDPPPQIRSLLPRPKPRRSAGTVQFSSKPDPSPTLRWFLGSSSHRDCPPELQKQKTRG